MKYVAFDTSSLTGLVTAFEIDGPQLKEVVSWSLSLETSRHSERLLWTIHTVLESAGWKIEDITAIAVGVGPGSFTGIRIGLTTAKMLASTLNIPVIPISSLALLARNALAELDTFEKTIVVACSDASKGEWFTLLGSAKSVRDCIAMAQDDDPGVWGRGVKEETLEPDTVVERVLTELAKWNEQDGRWIAVGPSVERYADVWAKLPQKQRIIDLSRFVHKLNPQALTELAFEAIQQGLSRPASRLKPRYLRDSEAEVKLRKGLLKPNPLLFRAGSA